MGQGQKENLVFGKHNHFFQLLPTICKEKSLISSLAIGTRSFVYCVLLIYLHLCTYASLSSSCLLAKQFVNFCFCPVITCLTGHYDGTSLDGFRDSEERARLYLCKDTSFADDGVAFRKLTWNVCVMSTQRGKPSSVRKAAERYMKHMNVLQNPQLFWRVLPDFKPYGMTWEQMY